jgi:hypothetical protein
MDGLPPPPPPGFGGAATAPPPPGYAPYGAQAQPPQRPVGRPSGDPDRDEARLAEKATLAKFVSALPKTATDYRVAVYRLKGRRGNRHDARPIAKILLSDLEEAKQQGVEPEDFIAEALTQKFGDQPMRVLCVPQDSHGKRVAKLAEWEMTLNAEEDEDMDYDDEDGDDIIYEDDPRFPPQPFAGPGGYQPFVAPPPPAPVATEGVVLKEAKGLMERQREAEQSHTALLVGMMQNQAQQQQQSSQMLLQILMQQQQDRERQAEERRREEQRLAEERRRDEERRAEERRAEEARRSSERMQLFATMAPAALPLLQRMMEGKEDKITPLLLTKLFDSDNNRTGMAEMVGLMAEASKQQVMMQSELAKQNMSQQTESSKLLMQHVLQMAQESVIAQRKLEETRSEGGGPMDTFANILQTVAPLLQSMQTGPRPASPVMMPPAPPIGMPQPQMQPLPQPVPPQRPNPAPQPAAPGPVPTQPPRPAQPTRATHPHLSDDDWVRGSLRTVAGLHQGQIPAAQRLDALRWMTQVLPDPLLIAIQTGDEDGIMQHSAMAVMSDEQLSAWLSEEPAQQYLRGCLDDIAGLLVAPAQDAPAPVARERKRPGKIPPPPVEDTEKEAVLAEEVVDFPASNGPGGETTAAPAPVEATAEAAQPRARRAKREGGGGADTAE